MVDEKIWDKDYNVRMGEFIDEGYVKVFEKFYELMFYFNKYVNFVDYEYVR